MEKVQHVDYLKQDVKIMLWDTAGEHAFNSITRNYYKGEQQYIDVSDIHDFPLPSYCQTGLLHRSCARYINFSAQVRQRLCLCSLLRIGNPSRLLPAGETW